jgi:hypothetical protein
MAPEISNKAPEIKKSRAIFKGTGTSSKAGEASGIETAMMKGISEAAAAAVAVFAIVLSKHKNRPDKENIDKRHSK